MNSALQHKGNVSINTVLVLSGMIVGKILSFVWRGLLTSTISATAFSDFMAFFMCINIASQIAFTPVNELVAKDAALDYKSRSVVWYFFRLYGAVCFFTTLLGASMMLVLATIYDRTELYKHIAWTVATLPMAGMIMFFVAMFRAAGDHISRALFYLIGIPLFFVIFLLIIHDKTLNNAVHFFFASYLLAALACAIYFGCRYQLDNTPYQKHRYELSKQMKFMVPLLLVQFLEASSGLVDSVVVGVFIYEAMGAYSNVSFLAKAVLMTSSALYFVIVPVFSRQLFQNDKASLIREYKMRTHHLVLAATPPTVFLIVYAHEVLQFLFSIFDQNMGKALQILAVGYLGATLHGPILALTLACGDTRSIFISTMIYLIVNSGFSLLLSPLLGVIGASSAAACGYLTSVLFLVIRSHYRNEIFSCRAVFYSISMGMFLYGTNIILTFLGLGSGERIILGGVILMLVSVTAYFLLLATSQEKLQIRRLLWLW